MRSLFGGAVQKKYEVACDIGKPCHQCTIMLKTPQKTDDGDVLAGLRKVNAYSNASVCHQRGKR